MSYELDSIFNSLLNPFKSKGLLVLQAALSI